MSPAPRRAARTGPWRWILGPRSTLTLVALLALARPASAQDLQNFKPAAGTWNLMSVETSQTAPEGRFVPTLWANWGLNPLVRRDANGDVIEKIIEHYATADLLATYGITDWLELAIHLPVSYTAGEGITLLGSSGFGLGDLRILPKVRLPWRLGGLIGLAFSLPVSLPTGADDRGMGAATTQLNPRAVADLKIGGFTATANVGFRYRIDDVAIERLALGNEVTYGAGFSAELGRDDLLALGELFGAAPANDLQSSNAAPLEALLGLRWFAPFGAVVTAGGGVGLINDYGSPDLRLLLGLGFFQLDRPVGDRDGDGLPDDQDQCPDDPEDKDGFQDADGCPDPDNDGDGILDADDQCPNEPEDKDGFQDADGCPDPDNDGDGILDVDDQCPNEPETFNDYKDEDGCPDRKVEIKVTQQKLEVLEPVFFDFDKATIKAESYPVLDAVAEALSQYPNLKIRVEGHTDTKGTDAYNNALSQARTESVVEYLIEKGGVARDRLVAKGYGKQRPLVDPNSPGADAKNRRVEFVIIEGQN